MTTSTVIMVLLLLVSLAAAIVIGRRRKNALAESEARMQVVAESEARFRAIADNIPQMAWMANSAGSTIWQNRRWFEYTGMQRGSENWEDFIHPDHLERVAKGMSAAEQSQIAFEDTFPIKGEDGTYRWFLSRAVPISSHDGQALYFGTDTDITESIESAERLKLLMREVDHRAKNLLELVQSLVAFTPAGSVEELTTSITERIASLGRTQSLLAENDWSNLNLEDAIVAQFAPILNFGEEAQVSVSGPEVYLHAKPVEELLMALHELATNAIKYGALSVEQGRVRLEWFRSSDGGLTLTWTEDGGPEIMKAPETRGFGLELIETLFATEDHSVFEWRSDGLKVEIRLGAEALAGPSSVDHHARTVLEPKPGSQVPVETRASSTMTHALVVEDDKMIARLIVQRLEKAGCKTIGPALTVEHALSLINSEPPPDVAFVDWNLNGVNAQPVVEALERACIPFCLATGNASNDTEREFEITLEKPFSAERFAEVLSSLLRQSQKAKKAPN